MGQLVFAVHQGLFVVRDTVPLTVLLHFGGETRLLHLPKENDQGKQHDAGDG